MRHFQQFVAIDWSGARGQWLRGIAVAECGPDHAAPKLVRPPGPAWSRADICAWLEGIAEAQVPAIVGLDLSPGFPFEDASGYFPGWSESPANMPGLWSLVERLSTADAHFGVDGFVRNSSVARHFRSVGLLGDLFPGGRGRLRRCEEEQLRGGGLSPSSCLNLIGAAQVGKSSLTGMRVLHRLRGRMPLWPLDPVPATGPMIVEIYTTIAARAALRSPGRSKMRDATSLDAALYKLGSEPHDALERYDDHATDAILTAAWLRTRANDAALWQPSGLDDAIATTEGWTFGVP